MRRPLAFLVLLVAAGAAAFAVARVAFDGPHGTVAAPGPPPAEGIATAMANAKQKLEEDKLKQPYQGPLGNFLVVPTEAEFKENAPCAIKEVRTPETGFLPSELNMPNMAEQAVCADGTVVTAHAQRGNKFYFTGKPRVAPAAPLDRLELTTVKGHEALVVKPVGPTQTYLVYAIERAPSGGNPGILVALISRQGLQVALESAAGLMGN